MNERTIIRALAKATAGLDAEGLLRAAVETFGDRVALATSLQAEDQAVTDMLCRLVPRPSVFTLDTGRLPAETHQTIQATQERYGIRIRRVVPDPAALAEMIAQHGEDLFRESVELRRLCCRVRKVEPLRRELAGLHAWITGLRAEQGPTRTGVQRVEWDESFGLVKLNPLADWTAEQVWDYLHSHDVPTNPLYDRGYRSIGCECCTRAVEPGEDIRAGRWWWEQPEHKECGLHLVGGRLVRRSKP